MAISTVNHRIQQLISMAFFSSAIRPAPEGPRMPIKRPARAILGSRKKGGWFISWKTRQ